MNSYSPPPLPDEWFEYQPNEELVPSLPVWWHQMPITDHRVKSDDALNASDQQQAYRSAQPFFHFLWNGAPAAYFWRLSDETYTKRDGTTDKRKWTQWFNVDQLPNAIDITLRGRLAHVYFGIAPTLRKGDGWQRGSEKGEKWPNFAHIRCFYGDFDAQDFDPDLKDHKAAYKQFIKDGGDPDEWEGMSPEKGKALALAHIRSLPLKPSVIIDSGGGYQPYWLLLLPTSDFARWKRIERNFVAAIGADDGAKDLARVMRCPGTYNIKPHYDEHKLVRIVEQDLTRTYTIDQIEEYASQHLPLMASAAKKGQEKEKSRKRTKEGRNKKHKSKSQGENNQSGLQITGVPVGFEALEKLDLSDDGSPQQPHNNPGA